MRIIKQVVRGSGYLPYVGSHPGTMMWLLFSAIGCLYGWIGFLVMFTFFGLIYAIGCYERAELNDRIERKVNASDQNHKEEVETEATAN